MNLHMPEGDGSLQEQSISPARIAGAGFLHAAEGALDVARHIPVGGDEEFQIAEGSVQDTVREKSDQDDGEKTDQKLNPSRYPGLPSSRAAAPPELYSRLCSREPVFYLYFYLHRDSPVLPPHSLRRALPELLCLFQTFLPFQYSGKRETVNSFCAGG